MFGLSRDDADRVCRTIAPSARRVWCDALNDDGAVLRGLERIPATPRRSTHRDPLLRNVGDNINVHEIDVDR